jgi:hypothetical protein
LADVFISYSRLDHERVQPIADRLASLGYTVWWDKHLRGGQAFIDEIDRQLDSAKCVLAVWSHNARNSTWVFAEAGAGLDQNKLLQLRLDPVQAPPPFDVVEIADMSGERSAWGPLEAALAKLVREGAAPADVRRGGLALMATPTAAGAPKLITIAIAATLAAFAGGLAETYNGVMTADQLQIALTGMLGIAGACAALAAHRLSSISRAGG